MKITYCLERHESVSLNELTDELSHLTAVFSNLVSHL